MNGFGKREIPNSFLLAGRRNGCCKGNRRGSWSVRPSPGGTADSRLVIHGRVETKPHQSADRSQSDTSKGALSSRLCSGPPGLMIVSVPAGSSIQVHRFFALVAAFGSSKGCMTATGAMVTLFFHSHPLLGAQITPLRDGPQNNLLSHGHGKVIYVGTWEVGTLVAALVFLFLRARSDLANLAVLEPRAG